MYEATTETVDEGRVRRYTIRAGGKPLACTDAWRLWQDDEAFRSLFCALLAESPFAAYRWETPPVTRATAGRQFEFVLVDAPGLAGAPDARAFAGYFTRDDGDEGVVVFPNLGGDAVLVVPSPRGADRAYTELAAFVRGAPAAQVHALWRVVGRTMQERVGERPLWLSTAGGGIAWLHVRLDSRPKYYSHRPYRTAG